MPTGPGPSAAETSKTLPTPKAQDLLDATNARRRRAIQLADILCNHCAGERPPTAMERDILHSLINGWEQALINEENLRVGTVVEATARSLNVPRFPIRE